MNSNGKKENILSSWKEIAAYLDRDVRTCVRWEKRYGLPIHRLERDSKAKVFAYRDQIDEWLAARSSGVTTRSGDKGLVRLFVRPLPVLLAVATVVIAVTFLLLRPRTDATASVPADFRIRGSELVLVDGLGRELWRFDTGLADLQTDAVYRSHFQDKLIGSDYVPTWPHLMIRDIDGDTRPEVLLSIQTKSENRMDTLFCFDDRGKERWRFQAGRELSFGGRTFRREYRVFGFNVDDYDGDGVAEVLVLSFHKPDWPCQAVLLDPAGKLEGEFWNAGYLMDGSAGDIDGDGKKELVLSGVNNEYRRGCLAVFEPGGLHGSSPQKDAAFRSPDLAEGGQSAYILFPKSEVHAAIRVAGDPVNYFWIHDGDGLTAQTCETQIFFDLDRTLVCRDITLSNYFQNLREEFSRKGHILPRIDEAFRRSLASSLLYYQNGQWLGAPAGAVSAAAPPH